MESPNFDILTKVAPFLQYFGKRKTNLNHLSIDLVVGPFSVFQKICFQFLSIESALDLGRHPDCEQSRFV